jgi:uncharacterized protein (DUF1501 family)
MKTHWTRRDFIKAGGLTAMALGLNALSPAIFRRRILAGPEESSKKLIFIFQRGGSDGVNTLIPRGDPEYSTANRPTLFIDEADALDLGNGFAQLHPGLEPLMEIYNHTSLTGTAGPGNLAVIHRVGYQGQSQSHFDSQQYWENGLPGQPSYEEGMLYRQVERTMDPATNHLVAAAISSTQMVALKGRFSLPTISSSQGFSFQGSPQKIQKFLGRLPSAAGGGDGRGMLGAYGGPRDSATHPYRDLVYGTGLVLADAVSIVQDAVALGPYAPENGAVYPSGSLGTKLQEVALLLKRTPVRVLGVNVGGWDTHTNQGGATGYHSGLLGTLAQGFQALYRDLQDQWQDLVIVTMTEFGRTSVENGSGGTDHAYACVVLCAGGAVKGGVYNCDATTWSPGDLFSQRGRYVKHRTDYRAVFGEIFATHFGDDASTLDYVIPGYSAMAAQPEFAPLGFI